MEEKEKEKEEKEEKKKGKEEARKRRGTRKRITFAFNSVPSRLANDPIPTLGRVAAKSRHFPPIGVISNAAVSTAAPRHDSDCWDEPYLIEENT